MFPLDSKLMIWMVGGDVVAADGMVMFSLCVLHIQYIDHA